MILLNVFCLVLINFGQINRRTKKSLEPRTIPGIPSIKFYQLFLLGCGVKQSLQYTGLSPLGLNGTIAILPQVAQVVSYI